MKVLAWLVTLLIGGGWIVMLVGLPLVGLVIGGLSALRVEEKPSGN